MPIDRKICLLVAATVSAAASSACVAPTGTEPAAACKDALDGHPTNLACTGLYSDFAAGAIASEVNAYELAVALWSDGASKRRFIRLPAGTTIDTTDMDHWKFPVGTKLWKEFSVGSLRAETRYLEKRDDGTWFRTTYAWSRDQRSATEVTDGVLNVWGTGFDIPSHAECATCHDGSPDGVLGFEAIGLSALNSTGLTMSELVARHLVTHPPDAPLAIPGTPTQVAALGWLHANCGNACHNRTAHAYAEGTGLFMRLTSSGIGAVETTDTYVTAMGVPSGFQPTAGAGFLRIKPGDVAHSAIPYRAIARNGVTQAGAQMPPIATRVPDLAGVALVDAWIDEM